jgi:hypothetical protein
MIVIYILDGIGLQQHHSTSNVDIYFILFTT